MTKAVKDGEMITLGFDGSLNDDSTALMATRVEDGHQFFIGVWQKPEGELGEQIKAAFDEGRDLLVAVIAAMGEEMAMSFKDAPK